MADLSIQDSYSLPPIPEFSNFLTPPRQSVNSNQNSPSSRPGAPQPSNVFANKVKEKLLRPALTSHYECWFNPPQKVRDWIKNNRGLDYDFNQELISLSCNEASLPGSSLMTNEITDDYTGVTERHAYRRQYDDRTDFTFYVDHGRSDGNYNVLWFFENWLAYIVDEQYANNLESPNYFYRVNFPNDYQSPALYINKFERDFAGQYLEYRFLEAYPISISSIPVSYESSQLLKCTVSFTYTRYLIRRLKNNSSLTRTQEPKSQRPSGVPNPPLVWPEVPDFPNESDALTPDQIRRRRLGL